MDDMAYGQSDRIGFVAVIPCKAIVQITLDEGGMCMRRRGLLTIALSNSILCCHLPPMMSAVSIGECPQKLLELGIHIDTRVR